MQTPLFIPHIIPQPHDSLGSGVFLITPALKSCLTEESSKCIVSAFILSRPTCLWSQWSEKCLWFCALSVTSSPIYHPRVRIYCTSSPSCPQVKHKSIPSSWRRQSTVLFVVSLLSLSLLEPPQSLGIFLKRGEWHFNSHHKEEWVSLDAIFPCESISAVPLLCQAEDSRKFT